MVKTVGYQLSAIRPSGGFGTACMLNCMVTGRNLSNSGGGCNTISPEVFEVLRNDAEVQELIKRKIAAMDDDLSD